MDRAWAAELVLGIKTDALASAAEIVVQHHRGPVQLAKLFLDKAS